MGRFRSGKRNAVRRRSGHHGSDRYMVMLMIRGHAARFVSRNIPPEIFPDSSDQKPLHITLYGPFTLSTGCIPEDITTCIESHGVAYNPLEYRISGLVTLRGRKGEALALEIRPGEEMGELYVALANCLRLLADTSTWIDKHPELRRLHITLAFNMRSRDADAVREKITMPGVATKIYIATRVTLMRNGGIWYTFDLDRHRWLDRAESFANPENEWD